MGISPQPLIRSTYIAHIARSMVIFAIAQLSCYRLTIIAWYAAACVNSVNEKYALDLSGSIWRLALNIKLVPCSIHRRTAATRAVNDKQTARMTAQCWTWVHFARFSHTQSINSLTQSNQIHDACLCSDPHLIHSTEFPATKTTSLYTVICSAF